MLSDKLQLSLVNSVSLKNPLEESIFPQDQAGFLRGGNYSWIVHDSIIQIISTSNGNKIGQYDFNKHHSSRECIISHVEEIDYLPGVCLLAIAVDFTAKGPSLGMISLLYVQGTKILGSLDFCEQITCCHYVKKEACNQSALKDFSGCLAIGTNEGKIFLIDLMIPNSAHEISMCPNNESEIFNCINVHADKKQEEIIDHHSRIVTNGDKRTFFSIQLEVLNDSGAVLSMLVMPNLYTMAVGLNDGRMVLYDLTELSAFHLAYPPRDPAPLTHMSFLEPTDDPRFSVYIWAFHSSTTGAVAVMHSLMYASKSNGIYEDFKSCSVRLTMPIFEKNTFPICCQSITRALTEEDDDILTLNVLAWSNPANKSTNVMIFDLNQWYKEEMPSEGDWKTSLKYAAIFELSNCTGLHSIVHEDSVYPFNSIMRPEEHFFPNSLSFDLCMLESRKISHFRWVGIQNIVLQQFNVIGPQVVYDPTNFFDDLTKVSIFPQFGDVIYNNATSIENKREFLLSVALEYNFVGFLRKCANAWADGSYLGKDSSTGIGLSTLTDWIWNRVRLIKEVCNTRCVALFDYSEQRIDYGTQKELSQCCKQLRILSDLLVSILRDYRQYVPQQIFDQLKVQSESIKTASDYQEVLQWLLNVGILPEGQYDNDEISNYQMDDEYLIVPYPYEIIRNHYNAQRIKLNDPGENEIKYLFIDAFIEKECNEDRLYETWQDSYPPKSIQSLLRILLIPEISLQSKHVIFIYLFMDITKVLSKTVYSSIVRNLIKFPAVFKMDPAVIKRTQAFWNLDNGKLDTAVEELISPLSHDKHIPLWQRELLIRTLLKNKENSLALRALRCPGNQISPELEMITLLDNNLLSEALKVQRASGDRELLVKFFHKILHSTNFEQLLDMRLSDDEGNVLREYLKNLKNSGLPNHLNIHFVFLLQRSKFIDAAHLVDSFSGETNLNLDPPKQVLTAYYAAMEPTTRTITSIIHSNDSVAKELPQPLSVNLIQAKCNANNNFYSKCVESITDASITGNDLPFVGSPKLGIFEYRQPRIIESENSFILDVNEMGKRKPVNEANILNFEEQREPHNKKRRLNDAISVPKRKSYMDITLNNLTIFKETKPSFNFSARNTPINSTRTTPERVRTFGNFLSTPVVNKKTPPKQRFLEKCPATPVSILKTRSMRGSLSPGRLSEFGDDNKSVKSITFAALPDSRDTSFNESSNLDEPTDTSTEAFYSPENAMRNFMDGPKPRKPLSGKTSPQNNNKVISPRALNVTSSLLQKLQNISQEVETFEETTKKEMERKIKLNELKTNEEIIADIEAHSTTLNTTVESVESDSIKPLRSGDILNSSSESDSEDSSEEASADKSNYGLQRKSILPASFGQVSDSEEDEDDEEVDEEHYEEEELPEHGDSEEDDDRMEYGEVELDDSDSDSNEQPQQCPPQNHGKKQEVICLDSDSDDDVQITQSQPQQQNLPTFDNFNQFASESTNGNSQEIITSQEEMAAMLYSDMDNDRMEQDEVIVTTEYVDIPQEGQNVQVSTADCSYESATGNEINLAIIGATSLASEVPQEETLVNLNQESENFSEPPQIEPENDIESPQFESINVEATAIEEPSNILNQAAVEIEISSMEKSDNSNVLNQAIVDIETPSDNQNVIETEPQNVTRSLRSRSVSVEPTPRETRCQSVPSNGSSSPKSRSTRASTEEREKPKRKLKKLEIIEEIDTPIPSPGVLTRKRSQLSLADSLDSPLTPTRMTRRKSLMLDEIASKSGTSTPSTPKRTTRTTSKESLNEESSTTLTRQRSLRKRATSASDNEDAKSTRSTRSTRKTAATPTSSLKSTPESPSSQQHEETSLTNRRLTRRQLQVVEKSRQLMENIGSLSSSQTEDLASNVLESDNESAKSETGSTTSSRASRKRKSLKSKDDDNSTKKINLSKAHGLAAIPEENDESVSKTPSKNRSRRK